MQGLRYRQTMKRRLKSDSSNSRRECVRGSYNTSLSLSDDGVMKKKGESRLETRLAPHS